MTIFLALVVGATLAAIWLTIARFAAAEATPPTTLLADPNTVEPAPAARECTNGGRCGCHAAPFEEDP